MLVSLKSKPPRIPDHDPGPLAPVLDWVDPRFGPILQVFGTQAAAPEPRWWLYNCTLARPLGEYFIDFDQIAMGSSISGSQALRRALGEAIERYNCASSFQFAETRFAPLQDNPMASLFPTCAEFESCVDSLKRLPLDKEITQVRMKTLAEDHEVWVPAGFVHLTFVRKKSEPMVATSITSGLAFHDDLTKAIWGGLMEYAERDAIMSVWWNRIESPRILINSQVEDVGLSERFRRLQSANSEAFLFDVTSDFRIPTVFCILKSKSPPYVTVGGACNDDPILACSKALDEAVMIRSVQKSFGKDREIPSFENFNWVCSLEDRAELYGKWKDSPAFDFLLKRSPAISLKKFCMQEWWQTPGNMDELRQFAKVMQAHEMTALWSDITIDDVKELGYCVKVVVPEMIPLTPTHNACFLGTRRLAKAAGKERLSQSDINPYPHPFP